MSGMSERPRLVESRASDELRPLFSEAAETFIAQQIAEHGVDDGGIGHLRRRKAVRIELMGDRRIGESAHADLQA